MSKARQRASKGRAIVPNLPFYSHEKLINYLVPKPYRENLSNVVIWIRSRLENFTVKIFFWIEVR